MQPIAILFKSLFIPPENVINPYVQNIQYLIKLYKHATNLETETPFYNFVNLNDIRFSLVNHSFSIQYQ